MQYTQEAQQAEEVQEADFMALLEACQVDSFTTHLSPDSVFTLATGLLKASEDTGTALSVAYTATQDTSMEDTIQDIMADMAHMGLGTSLAATLFMVSLVLALESEVETSQEACPNVPKAWLVGHRRLV